MCVFFGCKPLCNNSETNVNIGLWGDVMYASRWRSCASVRLYTHASVLTPSVYFCLSTCPDANTDSNRDTTWRRRLRTSGSREQTFKCLFFFASLWQCNSAFTILCSFLCVTRDGRTSTHAWVTPFCQHNVLTTFLYSVVVVV